MDALVTIEQLQARLPADAAVETTRTNALLVDASGAFRRKARQVISLVEDDVVTLRPLDGRVRLPQRPVLAVSSVVDADTDEAVDFTWFDGDEFFEVSTSVPLTVTYDHGYEETPDDVVGVIFSMVARALGVDPTKTGDSQESIQGYSHTIGSAAAAGAMGMLASEVEIALSYRRRTGALRLA